MKSQKKTIALVTLGCKVNTYEAESIGYYLENKGFLVKSGLVKADVYILSTCAVTNDAERKSRGHIAKIIKLNPDAEIYVCGCASEHDAEQFLKFPNVKYIVGTNNKLKVAKIISGEITPSDKYSKEAESIYNDEYISKHSRTRAVIKIQDGCNNFCTYCLIPYLRGRERSRSLSSIKREIEKLGNSAKEIVLTGINMSAYGKDLIGENLSLIDVCELFDGTKIKFRISSLEANVITDEFLTRLGKMIEFQPHFHLSMQSGCDNTLKNMNRKYTVKEFMSKVKLIRKYFPDAGITTDVIVGFPTETKEDFMETYKTCEKIGFSWIHVFPYSKRDGTVASLMKSVVTGDEVKQRSKKLTDLAIVSRENFAKKMKGTVQDLIIEQEKDGFFTGHSGNFIKCYLKSNKNIKLNQMVKVEIGQNYLDGALCEIWVPKV